MDFTVSSYRKLIQAFLKNGYNIVTVKDYLGSEISGKVIALRHDVDELPKNALKIAIAENDLGVKATYYFRRVSKSDHPDIIRQITAMGHEIGYHYEDLSKTEGDMDKAIMSFKDNLEYFRQYYPVKTVCMHGSSSSKYDNKDIWSHVSLSDFGLIGEPYLSFDFGKVFYMTDTGYAWDGGKYAVRDKVSSSFPQSYHNTKDVIEAVVTAGVFDSHNLLDILYNADYLLVTLGTGADGTQGRVADAMAAAAIVRVALEAREGTDECREVAVAGVEEMEGVAQRGTLADTRQGGDFVDGCFEYF